MGTSSTSPDTGNEGQNIGHVGLLNLSEMAMHDESNMSAGMLGATFSPTLQQLMKISEMKMHDELHDHNMLGMVLKKTLQGAKKSEMVSHDESDMSAGMLGATAPLKLINLASLKPMFTNPDNIAMPHTPGFKSIPVVADHILTGYIVKPVMMV